MDIAWSIEKLDLAPYVADVARLEERLHIGTAGKTIFITLRRFKDASQNHLANVVNDCLKQNSGKPVIVALMEPQHVDPAGYEQLQAWQKEYPNIQIIDFAFNPLALFLLFRKYHHNLLFIGPQFHAILSAHLTGVPYLPLAYDNKVHNLLRTIAPERTPITVETLRAGHLQKFIDNTYGATT